MSYSGLAVPMIGEPKLHFMPAMVGAVKRDGEFEMEVALLVGGCFHFRSPEGGDEPRAGDLVAREPLVHVHHVSPDGLVFAGRRDVSIPQDAPTHMEG